MAQIKLKEANNAKQNQINSGPVKATSISLLCIFHSYKKMATGSSLKILDKYGLHNIFQQLKLFSPMFPFLQLNWNATLKAIE